MSVKQHEPVAICRGVDVPESDKYGFTILRQGKQSEAFLIRFKGVVYGYLNQCVHMPKTLDCEDGNIFDETGQYLQCSMHKICYDPQSGACVSELCSGKKLTALKVKEAGDWVYWLDKRAISGIDRLLTMNPSQG